MSIARVTYKGQVTIPKRVREALSIEAGDSVAFVDFADALLAATALAEGPPSVCSFDTDFDRISGITRVTDV